MDMIEVGSPTRAKQQFDSFGVVLFTQLYPAYCTFPNGTQWWKLHYILPYPTVPRDEHPNN